MSRIDEEFDETLVERAQIAYDHAIGAADCDPSNDICTEHGVRVHPLGVCAACADDWEAPWIDPQFLPTRYGETNAA